MPKKRVTRQTQPCGLFTWSILIPAVMSIGIVKMRSGVFSATSSMSIPPSGEPTMTGPLNARSIKTAKYVSLVMSNAYAFNEQFFCCQSDSKLTCATITLDTGTPSGAVCFVVSLAPTIDWTSLPASAGSLVRWTPPLNPLSNVPLPRPPAKIWALVGVQNLCSRFSKSTNQISRTGNMILKFE